MPLRRLKERAGSFTKRWRLGIPMPAVLLFLLTKAAPSIEECLKLKKTAAINWNLIANKEWMESLCIDQQSKCIVETFYPFDRTGGYMVWSSGGRSLSSPGAPHLDEFRLKSGGYHQMLDTDHLTWSLEHYCRKKETSFVCVLFSKAMKKLTKAVMTKINDTLKRAGYKGNVTWLRTGCLKKDDYYDLLGADPLPSMSADSHPV
ncbi:uncharacterized protein LOC144105667 [Amblyomma americanum]